MGSETKNIVVIDDEKYVCNIIQEALNEFPVYCVHNFTDPIEAINFITHHNVDLVLTDLVMGDHSGVQVLDSTLTTHTDAVVILMTGHPTVKTAISVLQKGGYDYLVKPFKLEDLKATIARGLEHQQVKRENVKLRSQLELMKISDAVARGTKLSSLMKLVTETTLKEVGAEGVSILLLDRKANKYRLRCKAGDSTDALVNQFLDGTGKDNPELFDKDDIFVKKEGIKTDKMKMYRNYYAYPLISKGYNIGFINLVYDDKYDTFSPGQENLLSLLASTVATAVESSYMDRILQKSYLLTIKALANSIEARDGYTSGHTDRVYRVARVVARLMDWDFNQISNLRTGSILHDIGKIGVPDAILNKPAKLTDEEMAIMKKHPEMGMQILRGIPFLESVIPYVIAHHEKYDGTGYPYGLKGVEIPIEGRLMAVIDTFDAILSDRPYRPSADPQKAIDELITYRGTQFDPVIVDIFLEAYQKGLINIDVIYNRQPKTGKIPILQMKTEPV